MFWVAPVYLALQMVRTEVLGISGDADDDDDVCVCKVPWVYLELSAMKAEVFGYQ